ncbi:MAG: hypothetical protein ACI4N4_07680 [Candidatus Fimenecus sp.]
MKSDLKYIAKQILNLSEKKGVIGFACIGAREASYKNEDFHTLTEILKESDMKFVTVNYDGTYKFKTDIDATGVCDNFSYNFHKVVIPEKCIALVNLKPISGNESLLDADGALNKIILSVKYGKTSYNNIEKADRLFKENNIEVIGVIANKR